MGGFSVWYLANAAVGYWVFERASNQKKNVKAVGQVVGVLIIVLSFAGYACKSYYTAKCMKGGASMMPGSASMNCPFMPQPPAAK